MKLTDAVKKAVSQIASLVFVPRCASCYKVLPSKRIPLCEKCKSAYLLESKKLCKKCGRVHKMCVCRIKIGGTNVPFVHVTGYDVNRSSVSKNMILHIKDTRLDSAFDFLADEMLTALKERYIRLFERGNIVITYVPRSAKARRKAGHDQSEQLAMRISERSGAPFVPLFSNSSVKAQKKLDKDTRFENAMRGYSLIHPELKLTDRIIVIIDDIVTTGASIGACATLARRNGAKAVIGLVCAKTVSEKGPTEENYSEPVFDT